MQILNEFALPAHVEILILDRIQGLCKIINSFTVTRFYYCYFVFILGAERLKTDGKIRSIVDFFFWTNQHSGPDTELKVGQVVAVFLG